MAARAASLGDKGKNGQKKVEIWGWRWDMGNAFMLISFCKTVLESFSFVFCKDHFINTYIAHRWGEANCYKSACKCLSIQASLRPANKKHRLNPGIHTDRPNQDISLDI